MRFKSGYILSLFFYKIRKSDWEKKINYIYDEIRTHNLNIIIN